MGYLPYEKYIVEALDGFHETFDQFVNLVEIAKWIRDELVELNSNLASLDSSVDSLKNALENGV